MGAVKMKKPKPTKGEKVGVKQIGLHCDPNPTHRSSMEDEHVSIEGYNGDPNTVYLAIYDGHGGRETVEYVAEHLHEVLLPFS